MIEEQARQRELTHPEKGKTEFSALLDELVGQARKNNDPAFDDGDDHEDSDDVDEERGTKMDVDVEEVVDIIQVDKQMQQ